MFKDQNIITLFEAFSGVGTQAMALKRLAKELNFKLEVIGTSEIDKYAIRSYTAIHGDTVNFGSITDIQEIPQVDIFTYSFPCTDISNAGQQKGFERGSGTRSGLLWEVERILNNQKILGKLPKVLLLENVKALISKKFKAGFEEWLEVLENIGYTNYWRVLNSKDYGIAQNRERVFVVSTLDGSDYQFPKAFELTTIIKDYLEDEVDQKYFLSTAQIQSIKNTNYDSMKLNRIKKIEDQYVNTITAFKGGRQETKIAYPLSSREFLLTGLKDISPAIAARDYKDPKVIITPAAIRNRPNEDGVNERNLESNKDTVTNTITSFDKDNVLIFDWKSHSGYSGIPNSKIAPSQMAQEHYGITDGLVIRKLTPLESWRLMGITDEDFYKAQAVNSNSQLYKQAGNAIVVNVLYYIFKQLF